MKPQPILNITTETQERDLTTSELDHFATNYDPVSVKEVFDRLIQEHGDGTPLREMVIQQLAVTFVRLNRCARYEAETIREALNPPRYETVVIEEPTLNIDLDCFGKTETRLAHEGEKALLGGDTIAKLQALTSRHESQLFSRLMSLLAALRIKTRAGSSTNG